MIHKNYVNIEKCLLQNDVFILQEFKNGFSLFSPFKMVFTLNEDTVT